MAIPEKIIESWANHGAIVLSKQTHESIRLALTSEKSLIKGKDYKVYLQGSYKNSTNIRGDSDVDVVVELQSTFSPDISMLSNVEKESYKSVYQGIAKYDWKNFRYDVMQSLINYYGNNSVCSGNKSLKLSPSSSRLPADIIPCIQHRKYTNFVDGKNNVYIGGIKFYTIKENYPVINYPEIHYSNGILKNRELATNGWFKPTIRVFKNARNKLLERGLIPDELASSYHIENLLYNIPDELFGNSYQWTFYNIVNWLNSAELIKFTYQNGQLCLFGSMPHNWKTSDAKIFINGLTNLWNRWD